MTESPQKTVPPKAASNTAKPIVWESIRPEDIALLTATAVGWQPEVGDEIRGRVLAVKVGRSELPDRQTQTLKVTLYPIVFILRDGATEDDSAISLHCFHAVLQNEIMSAKPKFGDPIYVKYLGDMGRKPKSGMAAAEIYAVHVTNVRQEENVWDILKAQRPAPTGAVPASDTPM